MPAAQIREVPMTSHNFLNLIVYGKSRIKKRLENKTEKNLTLFRVIGGGALFVLWGSYMRSLS